MFPAALPLPLCVACKYCLVLSTRSYYSALHSELLNFAYTYTENMKNIPLLSPTLYNTLGAVLQMETGCVAVMIKVMQAVLWVRPQCQEMLQE